MGANQLSRVSGSKIEGRLGEAVDDRLGRTNCRLRHAPECPRALGERIYRIPCACIFSLGGSRTMCDVPSCLHRWCAGAGCSRGLPRDFTLLDGCLEPLDIVQQALTGEDQEVVAELRVLKVDLK
jgi:hypothetical protein